MNAIEEININKPIEEVWEVLGQQFAQVSDWASIFFQSEAGGEARFEGIDYSYRKVVTPAGANTQLLETFDTANHRLSYRLSEGAPEIAKAAYATWSCKADASGETIASFDFTLEPKMELDEAMATKMEMGLRKSALLLGEELKHYLETGEVHPNKVAQRSKN